MYIGKSQTDEKKEKASETDSTPKFSFVLSRKRTRAEMGIDDSGIVVKRERLCTLSSRDCSCQGMNRLLDAMIVPNVSNLRLELCGHLLPKPLYRQ